MRQCWICGNIANSGEHMIKKSDIKRLMPNVSQKSPIYTRKNGIIKRPIGSNNATAFKYSKSICSKCNGSLTQPHDMAWETLSEYLGNSKLTRNATINLSSIYPLNKKNCLKDLQLYFVKMFGCKAIDSQLPLDLSKLADDIQNNNPSQNIYLKLRHSDNGKSADYCVVSNIEAAIEKGTERIIYAHFYYTVGVYTMDVIYAPSPSSDHINLSGYIHPNDDINALHICNLNYDQRNNITQ